MLALAWGPIHGAVFFFFFSTGGGCGCSRLSTRTNNFRKQRQTLSFFFFLNDTHFLSLSTLDCTPNQTRASKLSQPLLSQPPTGNCSGRKKKHTHTHKSDTTTPPQLAVLLMLGIKTKLKLLKLKEEYPTTFVNYFLAPLRLLESIQTPVVCPLRSPLPMVLPQDPLTVKSRGVPTISGLPFRIKPSAL